jgi:hypothetical protein
MSDVTYSHANRTRLRSVPPFRNLSDFATSGNTGISRTARTPSPVTHSPLLSLPPELRNCNSRYIYICRTRDSNPFFQEIQKYCGRLQQPLSRTCRQLRQENISIQRHMPLDGVRAFRRAARKSTYGVAALRRTCRNQPSQAICLKLSQWKACIHLRLYEHFEMRYTSMTGAEMMGDVLTRNILWRIHLESTSLLLTHSWTWASIATCPPSDDHPSCCVLYYRTVDQERSADVAK